TIFNARLGWWVPNPAKSLWVRIAPKGLGFFQYLCAELFGTATSQSEFVYLSDGGHFENLGIYELVRRRCRFIIAVDGEEDGLYAFHGLGTAIRRCRVDFDAEIDINVEDIRPTGAMGLSRCHCAVGRIKYPARGGLAESEGVLLYLKSSLTGDEGTDVQQYKAADPAFPHQSTGDQFFSESQFESYRTLGFHVAREAMEKLFHGGSLKNVSDGAFIDTVTKELKAHWYRPLRAPTETFVSHTQALDDLWADLAESGRPACLAELTLPNWESFVAGVAPSQRPVPAASFPEDPEEQRQVYAFCQRLIQLMENVYLDMNLRADGDHPDNSGWIALFRHWMGHPIVRRAWEHSQQTFGQRFGTFWKDLESAEAEKARLALPVKAAKRTNGAAKVNGGKKKAKPKPKDN
ncbi:MAG TPA: hypothetical protein VD994_20240, partial [Prosthecobacter sp.]|nr:hypothetical protein [Prosthecobacter sp.]